MAGRQDPACDLLVIWLRSTCRSQSTGCWPPAYSNLYANVLLDIIVNGIARVTLSKTLVMYTGHHIISTTLNSITNSSKTNIYINNSNELAWILPSNVFKGKIIYNILCPPPSWESLVICIYLLIKNRLISHQLLKCTVTHIFNILQTTTRLLSSQ